MAGPWIKVTPVGARLPFMSWDQLTDRLQRMGKVGRNGYPPREIKAAFREAARRNIMSDDEADAGIAICLRVPLERRRG